MWTNNVGPNRQMNAVSNSQIDQRSAALRNEICKLQRVEIKVAAEMSFNTLRSVWNKYEQYKMVNPFTVDEVDGFVEPLQKAYCHLISVFGATVSHLDTKANELGGRVNQLSQSMAQASVQVPQRELLAARRLDEQKKMNELLTNELVAMGQKNETLSSRLKELEGNYQKLWDYNQDVLSQLNQANQYIHNQGISQQPVVNALDRMMPDVRKRMQMFNAPQ